MMTGPNLNHSFFKSQTSQIISVFLSSKFMVKALIVCFATVSCGVDSNVDESAPLAIQSDNETGFKDRVYLALDEVEVSGVKTKAYYIVGCLGEPVNPKSQISVYNPVSGWEEKGLHERKWLWEFNPFIKKNATHPGDCEVLLGDPTIQKFKYEVGDSSSWFGAVGLAGAGCVGMSASAAALVMDHDGLSIKAFQLKSGKGKFKQIFAAAGLGTGTFFCAKNSIGLINLVKNQRHEKNRKLFAQMFDLAFQDSLNYLRSSEDETAVQYRAAVDTSKAIQEDQNDAFLKGVGILAERTVETFNSDLTLWKKSTNPELVSGEFKQGLSFDFIYGKRQFFDAIEGLGKVRWDESEDSSLHDIPDEIRNRQDLACRSLEVRDHEVIEQKDEGVPVYLDRNLSYKIGRVAIGTPLKRLEVKDREYSREIPAYRVQVLDSDPELENGIESESLVWIHPVFTQVKRTQSCTSAIEPNQE